MNPFVHAKKRGVELPKGYKDLMDVLGAKKCQYCDNASVATLGWPGDYRWCEACQRDLAEFAKIELPMGKLVDGTHEAAVSRYKTEMRDREEDFMRQKVRERRPGKAA